MGAGASSETKRSSWAVAKWKVNTDAAVARQLNPEPPPKQLTRRQELINGVWHDVKLTPWQEAAHNAEGAERDRIAACRAAKKATSVMVAQLWLYPKRSPLLVKHGPDGPGLRRFYDSNNCFPGWQAPLKHVQRTRQAWFHEATDDIARWFGVTVDPNYVGDGGENDRVVGLALSSFGLRGPLMGAGLIELERLTELNLEDCSGIVSLPDEVGDCSNLTVLNAARCWKLATLPNRLCDLPKLNRLDMSGCEGLKELPDRIGSLPALAWLELFHCNTLKKLPNTMVDLKTLNHLGLGDCMVLAELPDLSKLTKLKVETNIFSSNEVMEWATRKRWITTARRISKVRNFFTANGAVKNSTKAKTKTVTVKPSSSV
jgi:hypothetical protein